MLGKAIILTMGISVIKRERERKKMKTLTSLYKEAFTQDRWLLESKLHITKILLRFHLLLLFFFKNPPWENIHNIVLSCINS